MRLLMVRHGTAEDREAFALTNQDDSRRPLTPKGIRRLASAASGIHELVPDLSVLATSPYVRATQTADILMVQYEGLDRVELAALVPDADPVALAPWLDSLGGDRTVGVVGHEPHLSALAGWLLTGRSGPLFELKKGGAALLEWDGRAGSGARLLWLATPGLLRRYA